MNNPRRIGLTGSIAMGKTTVAKLFRECGLPVFDADAAIRKLYDDGGGATELLGKIFPGVIVGGRVNRVHLLEYLQKYPSDWQRLNDIIHPLVAAERAKFWQKMQEENIDWSVYDIPLLFESNQQQDYNYIVVASAPLEVQLQRLQARPNMTEDKIKAILARQMPDEEKRLRADYIINTDQPLEKCRLIVKNIVENLRKS